MTRWLAIPVAAIIAVAAGVVTWTTTPTTTEAGASNAFTMSIDCDVATGGIQTSCVTSAGAFAANVVVTNNSGAAVIVGAFGFDVVTNQGQLNPTTPACDASGLNCNPDFNQAAVTGASFACSPPAPVADNDPDPAVAVSRLGCFSSSADGPSLANGASIVLATVSYTAADGVTSMTLANDANFYDENFTELGSCNTTIAVPMVCPVTDVQIGASAATNTPTNTPTNTVVVPTNTPCVVGQTCATATSLAYVTVTPTPVPATPTVVGGGTTVAGQTPGAPPPPPPPPPGGGTAPGGNPGGTITLPDTGSGGSADTNTWIIALAAAAVVGAAGLGSGLWFSTAAARRQGED